MPLKQFSQLTEQTETLNAMLDIELKICQILNIHLSDIRTEHLKFNLEGLNSLKTILKKIYNRLLVNSSPIQKINSDNERSELFEIVQKKQAYEQIQDLLQKEENKNRCLLRKQFEFKEFQSSIMEELNDEKSLNRKLNHQINKLTDELQEKTLEIMHLKNQARAYQRGSRELFCQQRSDILASRAYNLSTLAYAQLNKDPSREDKKLKTSRQKYDNKQNGKKVRELKEKALYALYNNHKKNHSQTINALSNHDKTKKGSTSQKNTNKKQLMKEMNSIEYSSNKKSIHARRKSEQFINKRTPSQREGRESKMNKKRRDQAVERLDFY